jgi:hypothetical protein
MLRVLDLGLEHSGLFHSGSERLDAPKQRTDLRMWWCSKTVSLHRDQDCVDAECLNGRSRTCGLRLLDI